MNSAGLPTEAMDVLKEGYKQHLRNLEIIHMLASIYRDQGHKAEAPEWARKLSELNPADQQAMQFIQQLESSQ